jgi:hypothetical protein
LEDPDAWKPGYDEAFDSENVDTDPDFRETLRILNAAGVHTVSSCQGHAPGTQYDDVQEWMEPYVTVRLTGNVALACEVLRIAGGELSTASPVGKALARFPRGWEWRKSVDALRSRFPLYT